ncbi:MAG TPA: tetratricopeptide repeat protein [Thermoanaerobaculia bacterium]|nr:tetratricopeptide repeat protein [Thermoanaerobaculia bacterium]
MRIRPAALLLLASLPALAQAPPVEKPPLRVLRTGGLRVETAALLMSGQEGGTIPVAALALPLPGTGERARVAVLLEMDGSEAMEGQQGDLLRLEVCLYAVTTAADGSGRVAGSRMDTVEIDLARLGPDLDRSGLKYMGELALAPGDYALRALVRNAATGEVGLRVLPLSVPDFSGTEGVLLPPLVSEPAGSWLIARGAGIASPPPSLSFDALPSARPVFAPSGEISFRVPAWKTRGSELQAEVRRPGGARVATFPLKVASREEAGAGLELLTASVELKGIEEGVYEIGVVEARAGAEDAAFSTPFVLLNRGSDGQVWAALTPSRRSQSAAREEAPAQARKTPAATKRTRKIDAKPVREAYHKALLRLAEGDREGARDAVFEMETSVLTGDRPATSDDLMDVELEVARDLARKDPESLVPVLTLHQVLYRDALRKPSFQISTHSRELVFRLIDLYAETRGTPEAKTKAAHFMMGLAAEMIWNAPPSMRARVFRQILAYDENQEAALLCLAVDSERQGRYSEAVGHLERLIRQNPANDEARLRLAVNLARLGKAQDARKLLREVSAGKTESWQLAVAWQELGRLLLASGDLAGAEQTLREGLQRLPDDDKLALQLGLVLDLRKDPRGAREAVAGLGEKTGGEGGAARHRYNQLPLERLDEAWAELQETAVEQIPLLAAALGVPVAGETPRNTP